jgi:F0F1-type ATP synthase assembly protein I
MHLRINILIESWFKNQMRICFLSGLLLVFISIITAWITDYYALVVFINLIVGLISLVIALYLHIGMVWFYRYNQFRNNHDHAYYKGRNRLKYMFVAFGIPNVVVGEIVNRVFGIWT